MSKPESSIFYHPRIPDAGRQRILQTELPPLKDPEGKQEYSVWLKVFTPRGKREQPSSTWMVPAGRGAFFFLPTIEASGLGEAALAPAVEPLSVQVQRELRLPLLLGLATCLAYAALLQASEPPLHPLAIITALMASACLSSIVGFAFSAIAGVVLYQVVASPLEAVRIMLWCSIAIQLYSVTRLWKAIRWAELIPFLAGGMLTVVPFCWLVLRLSPRYYLAGIGLLISVYGAYLMMRKPVTFSPSARAGRYLDLATGALGGITGPFAAFPGAAITIWCSLRGWDKLHQRAIFQPYILIMQILTLAVLSILGSKSSFHASNALFAIPALLGCHLGLMLFERLSNHQFNRLVQGLLILSGVSMLFKLMG